MPVDFPEIDRPYDTPYKIIVKQGNLYWKAKTDTGRTLDRKSSNTSLEDLINLGFDNLDADRITNNVKQKVLVSGYFKVDKHESEPYSLELPPNTILDNRLASYFLENNSDVDFIRNKNFGSAGIDWSEIWGGFYDLNKANQASGNGFNFEGTSGSKINHLKLKDIRMRYVKGMGLRVKQGHGLDLDIVKIQVCDDIVMLMDIVSDSNARDLLLTNSNAVNLHWKYSSSIDLSKVYCGGSAPSTEYAQVILESVNNAEIENLRIDSSYAHALILYSQFAGNKCNNNVIRGVHCTRSLRSVEDKVGIVAYDATGSGEVKYNQILGFYIGKKGEGTEYRWDKGIEESGAGVDYNLYHGGVIKDYKTTTHTIAANSNIKDVEGVDL